MAIENNLTGEGVSPDLGRRGNGAGSASPEGGDGNAENARAKGEGSSLPPLASLVIAQTTSVGVAFAIAFFTRHSPLTGFRIDLEAVAIAFAGLFALLLAMAVIRLILPRHSAGMDDAAKDMFRQFPVKLTWPVILFMSLLAGVCEELLFRGALQGWLDLHLPSWAAILIPAAIFALMHPHSIANMVYVLMIAIWLGTLYALTGNIFVVMAVHFAYDVYALSRIRRLLAAES